MRRGDTEQLPHQEALWRNLLTGETPSPSARQSLQARLRPHDLQVQTTTLCNARCVFCPYGRPRDLPPGTMEMGLFERVLHDAAVLRPSALLLDIINEPLMDPLLIRRIHLAKEVMPDVEVVLTTNGSLLSPDLSGALAASPVDVVWFSVNGVDRETYESTMRNLDFQQTISRIQDFLRRKSERIQCRVNIVLTSLNRREINRIRLFWARMGLAAGVTVLSNRSGHVEDYDCLQPRSGACRRMCERPFEQMFINVLGQVVLCVNDWEHANVMGQLGEASLLELWHGRALNEVRRTFLTDNLAALPKLCAACSDVTRPVRRWQDARQ